MRVACMILEILEHYTHLQIYLPERSDRAYTRCNEALKQARKIVSIELKLTNWFAAKSAMHKIHEATDVCTYGWNKDWKCYH